MDNDSRGAKHPPAQLLRSRMPELDTLRGIAVLGVIFLHGFYWQYSGLHFARWQRALLLATKAGWLGVNLFFVLSGFLITGILLDSRDRPGYYRRFYARRALRILPAYYLLLIGLAVLRQASLSYLGLSSIYLANLTVLFGVANDYGPLWSLAVEEHFYIVWPALVRRAKLRGVAALALGICLAEPLLRAAAFQTGKAGGIATYTWFVADGLAMGGGLAVVLRSPVSRRQVKAMGLMLIVLAASAAVLGGPFGLLTRDNLLGAALQHTVINLGFSGVLLLALLLGTSAWQGYVNSSVLRFLGYISYGLYLIHLLIFRIYDKLSQVFWPQLQPRDGLFGLIVLRFVCVLGLSVGLAYLSRRFFEERFLRLKQSSTPKGRWALEGRLSSASSGGQLV
jgi:peptidoglycan/LPS O-acetylase OafA/YrhL